MPNDVTQEGRKKSRLLARLVRELMAGQRFESLHELTDALKRRCAQLRVHWTQDDISAAYRLIASNTSLVTPHRTRSVPVRPAATARPLTRREAADAYALLWDRFNAERNAS